MQRIHQIVGVADILSAAYDVWAFCTEHVRSHLTKNKLSVKASRKSIVVKKSVLFLPSVNTFTLPCKVKVKFPFLTKHYAMKMYPILKHHTP